MNISEHNEELYKKMFSKADEYHSIHKPKIKKMIGLIEGQPKRILDLGCGDGWVGELLIKKFGSIVHGVDILDKALKKAKKRGLITKKFDLSINKWPYKSNTFDLIIAGDIIEHLYDTEKFIKECRRLLKKNGQLILSTPNINSYVNRLLVLFGKMPLWIDFAPNLSVYKLIPTFGHIRAFNKDALIILFEHCKLRIEKVYGSGVSTKSTLGPKYKTVAKIIDGIEGFMSKFTSLASVLIVKAKK